MNICFFFSGDTYIRFLFAIKSPDFYIQEILPFISLFTRPPSPNAYDEKSLSHISLLPYKHVIPMGTYFVDKNKKKLEN